MKGKAPVVVPDLRGSERRAHAYAHAVLTQKISLLRGFRVYDAVDIEKELSEGLPVPPWCAH